MDFEKFYDDQSDYELYRSNESARAEYEITTTWKSQNLSALVPEGISIENAVEIGSAFGLLLSKLKDTLKIKQAFGVDISKNNINYGIQLFPNLHFILGTIEDLKREIASLPFEKFNLTILSDIIEHIPDDKGFLSSIANLTEYAIINLPLEKSFNTRNRHYGENDPSGHLRSYDFQSGKRLIEESGFTILKFEVKISMKDPMIFQLERNKIKQRLKKKIFVKQILLYAYYVIMFQLRHFPKLYVKYFGANLFALCKSNVLS